MRTIRLVGLSSALLLVTGGTALSAQRAPSRDLSTLSLEELMDVEVVYGASKFDQKVTEAPASVSVVTSADIEKYGYRTLADVLRSLRGFYTSYDRNYTYVGVRGFSRPSDYNSRFLLLLDGHRVNESVYGSALMGTEQILDVEMIDRVEVIRGPSSSLYGSSAFLAVINVVTRRPPALDGTEIAGRLSSYRSGEARAAFGKKFAGGTELVLSASGYDSDGQKLFFEEFDDPATNNGFAEGLDDDRYYRGLATLRAGGLTAQAAYSWREKGIPTGSFGTVFDDSSSQTIDRRAYLSLAYERSLQSGLHWLARASYDGYYYRGDYALDYPPVTVFREQSRANWLGVELQASRALGDRHFLTGGGEYRDYPKLHYHSFDVEPFADYTDVSFESSDWGVFVQDQFSPTGKLKLSLGLRHDHYESWGGSTNPRLAVIYAPTAASSLKILYGEAFRTPNAAELRLTSTSNPDIEPEEIREYSLILEQYVGKTLRLTGNLFYYRINDLISVSPSTFLFENLSTVDSYGAEVEVERRWGKGLDLRMSYAFQHTADLDLDEHLSNSPRHLAKINFAMPLPGERLRLGSELQYTSKRLTLSGGETDGFLLANVTFLAKDLVKRLDFSASIYNLFDEEYGDPGASFHTQEQIPQDGRTYQARLTCRF